MGRYLTDTTGSAPERPHPVARVAAALQRGRRRAACTSTCRGGSTTASSTSRAATTSSSGGGRGMPGYGLRGRHPPADRRRLRQEAEGRLPPALRGSIVGFAGRGEMIPNEDSYCEIDPEVVDRWGIPVLRFHWKWSDHELSQARHMQRDLRRRSSRRWAASWSSARSPARDEDHGHHGRAARSSTRWAPRAWARARDVGAERVVPGPRREEPVRGRQRALRHQRPQELTWTILALAMRTASTSPRSEEGEPDERASVGVPPCA